MKYSYLATFLFINTTIILPSNSSNFLRACQSDNAAEVQSILQGDQNLTVDFMFTIKEDPRSIQCTPLYAALRKNSQEVIKYLFKKSCDPNLLAQYDTGDKMSPIYLAVHNKNHNTAELLLKNNADPNVGLSNTKGIKISPLYQSIESFNKAAEEEKVKHLDFIKLLLENGAGVDLGYSNSSGAKKVEFSPLWFAAFSGLNEVVSALLEKDASLNKRTYDKTPYEVAKSSSNVKELIKRFVASRSNAECSICLSSLQGSVLHFADCCNSCFHAKCCSDIEESQEGKKCPNCREPLKSIDCIEVPISKKDVGTQTSNTRSTYI